MDMGPEKPVGDRSSIGACPVISLIVSEFTNEEVKFHRISVAKNLIYLPVYLIPRGNNIGKCRNGLFLAPKLLRAKLVQYSCFTWGEIKAQKD